MIGQTQSTAGGTNFAGKQRTESDKFPATDQLSELISLMYNHDHPAL